MKIIFFTEEIEPYNCPVKGGRVKAFPCTLDDDREGYFLDIGRTVDVVNLGIVPEIIDRSKIVEGPMP